MNVFSGISIVAMMLLVVVDVILRLVFKTPIVGATELIQILVVVEMASLAASILENRQVSITIAFERFPPKMQLIVDIITYTATIVLCILATYASLDNMLYSFEMNTGYHFIGVPYWPFLFLFGLGFFTGAIGVITILAKKIKALVSGNYEGEIMYTEKQMLEMAMAADSEENNNEEAGE